MGFRDRIVDIQSLTGITCKNTREVGGGDWEPMASCNDLIRAKECKEINLDELKV